MGIDVQKVAAAIYASRTRKEAARILGVSERVIFDYLKNCEVQAALKLIRFEVYAKTVEQASGAVSDSLAALREIVKSEEAANPDKIRAAGMLLQFGRETFRDLSAAESAALETLQRSEEAEDERNGILHFNFGNTADEPEPDYPAMIAELLDRGALARCTDMETDEDGEPETCDYIPGGGYDVDFSPENCE